MCSLWNINCSLLKWSLSLWAEWWLCSKTVSIRCPLALLVWRVSNVWFLVTPSGGSRRVSRARWYPASCTWILTGDTTCNCTTCCCSHSSKTTKMTLRGSEWGSYFFFSSVWLFSLWHVCSHTSSINTFLLTKDCITMWMCKRSSGANPTEQIWSWY